MQETFDFYTLIIVITFLGMLLLIAYVINKKKEFFKSHINKNRSINLISSTLLGGGNRAVLFKVDKKTKMRLVREIQDELKEAEAFKVVYSVKKDKKK